MGGGGGDCNIGVNITGVFGIGGDSTSPEVEPKCSCWGLIGDNIPVDALSSVGILSTSSGSLSVCSLCNCITNLNQFLFLSALFFR